MNGIKISNVSFLLVCSFVFFLGTACSKAGDESGSTSEPSGDSTENTDPDKPLKTDVQLWLTNADQSALFKKQKVSLLFSDDANQAPVIQIDTAKQFQTVDGFGYCLTGGSAYLIYHLPPDKRQNLLQELFATDSGSIGISYLRVSIGASDLSRKTFSYDDVKEGETDTALTHFDLGADKYNLVPLLKEILSINPDIKIMGSPWSAPVWMKTNNSTKGGKLDPQFYDTYAAYFVKYIRAMEAEGIHIDAITPQNEPLNPDNNPSMVMTAAEEADFIKNALGPAFEKAGIKTKIIIYDHNCDRPDYPLDILKDKKAAQYIDGSAFHLYAGEISALSKVHDTFPNKNVYFTEQWTGGPGNFAGDLKWHVQNLIIGAMRNWSKIVLEWNLAANADYEPHTNGGCSTCMGALTIEQDVSRNVSYYVIASASRFVRPGAVRIGSNIVGNLHNVAFQNTDGSKVLIVLNTGNKKENFNVQYKGKRFSSTLKAGSVGTYVW